MIGATLGSAVVAAVMAALVSAGGPGITVAVADPGSHSSHSSPSRDRDGRGSQRNSSADRHGAGRQGHGADDRRDGRTGRPERDLPSAGPKHTDSWNPNSRRPNSRPPNSRNAQNDTAALAPSARTATSQQARGQSDEQVTAPVDQQEPVVALLEPQPAADAGGGGGGGGSIGPAVTMSVPRVVFGNGRTPGAAAPRPEVPPLVIDSAVLPSADAPEPAAAPPSPTARLHAPTIVRRTMTPLLTPAHPALSVSWRWGLAGLILAPLAGVLLGYRQARANKAAAELKSALSG